MAITPQTNTTLEQIADIMRAHDDFVLCGHVNPDGDCLGSQLCLAHALRALGKRVTCVMAKDDPLPAELLFMPGIEDMIPASTFKGDCSVFVGLDVPMRERIGEAVAILDASETSITVDHHASDTTMCDHVYVDPDSASASLLVWELVKHLTPELPKESALCAYVGLVTDTGGFRYQNSDAHAFECASELVGQGIDPSYVATHVFQNRTLKSLQLESLVISRMILFSDGQGAISWVSLQDMQELCAAKSDTEALIEALRCVQGVRVACLLREQEEAIRGSLRSKDATDVSALARKIGGGGHKAAAGITVAMPLQDAVQHLKREISALLSESPVA